MRTVKPFGRRHCCALAAWCLAASAWAQQAQPTSPPPYVTDTLVYPQPARHCLSSTTWSGDLQAPRIRHQLVVEPAHQGLPGDVFVVFWKGSAPHDLWLYGVTEAQLQAPHAQAWTLYAGNAQPPSYHGIPQTALQALYTLDALPSAAELPAYPGAEGHLIVGYGLRPATPGATAADAWQEMLTRQRYASVWHADKDLPLRYGALLCVTFTELTRRTAR